MIIFDSGNPSQNYFEAVANFRNGSPPVENIDIYNPFPMDPMATPYGWMVEKLTTYHYIHPDLAAAISSVYVCVRLGITVGDGGSILYEGTIPATLTNILEPTIENGNVHPLYEIVATPASAFSIMDTSATGVVDFWVTITPIIDPQVDIAAYGFDTYLAYTDTPPLSTTAYIDSSGFVDPYEAFNFDFQQVSPLLPGPADFAFLIEGSVFAPPPGICDGPDPPAYCSAEFYPYACKTEDYPSICLLPPPSLCVGPNPPAICSLLPPEPEPEPEPAPIVIPMRQFGAIKLQRTTGYWRPI